MSTWFEESISCPACGQTLVARLARGVHVPRAPEVREQLFARTFHRVSCACGHVFTAARPLIYTDTDRKHWVSVASPIERPRWPDHERAADELFDRAMTGSPLTHPLRDGFTIRVVFGLEELREKLVIWDANLDDAVVECLKTHVVSERPQLARAKAIVVDAVIDGALELVVDNTERLAVPAELVERFHDDERLVARFPELFGGRFVSIVRYLGAQYRWTEPRS